MRTFRIPFSFVSSPETEKERLLYALESVANGFYPRHGYLVLPKTEKGYEQYNVVIPEVVKNFSKLFWQDAAKYGSQMPKVITKRMWKEAKDINLPPVSTDKVNEFKNKWLEIGDKAISAIEKYFPSEIKWVKSVEVRLTKVGSGSSHYLLIKKRGQHLSMAIREDMSVDQITNLFVLALIYPLEKELFLSFTHRQTLRNFILSRNEFKSITDLKPEIFDNIKIPIALRKKSDEYIKYLGIPNIIDPIKLINENISMFGAKEEKLLTNLVLKNGEVLTYDNIADLIWGEGKFKSYWAINKIVQRINKKLKDLKISYQIKGVRGIGYKAN